MTLLDLLLVAIVIAVIYALWRHNRRVKKVAPPAVMPPPPVGNVLDPTDAAPNAPRTHRQEARDFNDRVPPL